MIDRNEIINSMSTIELLAFYIDLNMALAEKIDEDVHYADLSPLREYLEGFK
tara:strand:+ start:178 stop:333 length:156 start_codon:yes stop_codon:yes gene_type:complete